MVFIDRKCPDCDGKGWFVRAHSITRCAKCHGRGCINEASKEIIDELKNAARAAIRKAEGES